MLSFPKILQQLAGKANQVFSIMSRTPLNERVYTKEHYFKFIYSFKLVALDPGPYLSS